MSRIIVKQLPKNITEDKVRSLFSTKGIITDIQLKYTADGKFRQFCFIGYQNEDEAQAAIKHFNNSCIQTSRIKVELCAALGSEDKPKSWSKYAKDSKVNEDKAKLAEAPKEMAKKKNKITKFDEIVGPHKDDPEFQEFVKAHDKHRVLWANDADTLDNKTEENEQRIVDNKTQEDDEGKDSGVVETDDDDEEQADNDSENEQEQTEKLAEKPISDLEYMKSLINKDQQQTAEESSTKTPTKMKEKKATTTKTGLDLFTIKMHNVPYNTKRQDVLKFFKPLKPYSVRLPTNVHGFCYVGFKTEKDMAKAMLKNKSFIKGKQVFFSDFTEKNKLTKNRKEGIADDTKDNTNNNKVNSKWQMQEESIRKEEHISESGCIFFRNLPYTVTEEDLQQLFEKFGPVAEVNLPVDKITRKIKGFGTVTFVMPEHALLAFNKLDGTDFHGRLLHLIPGKSKADDADVDEKNDSLTFKQKKQAELKKTAQQAGTWNTLFLGSNAVAEIIAKQFNMTKENILDTEKGGSSAAVRIALGETQIVIEMKKFLEEQNVSVNAFDAPNAKRSKTIILAKNLPANTSVQELKPIFGKFGPIGRLVLPPSGVTAIVEYCDPAEARQAFKKLAFSKFKNVPLFLEWAPENTFTKTLSGEAIEAAKEETQATAETKEETITPEENVEKNPFKKELKKTKTKVEETVEVTTVETAASKAPQSGNNFNDDEDEPAEDNTTLFLRNLNFKTVPETVYKHFQRMGAIHTVEIAKRRDPKDPRYNESLGYGFIQFKKSATAEKVLKDMQFTQIDGNQVELKRSDRVLKTAIQTTQRKKTNQSKQTGTKILVRNIPFQAHAREVRDIFKAFGEIRTLRIPKKMTEGEDAHRGFGFVDYLTKEDAKRAFDALSQSTHLYGRRLVLEWASTIDDDIGEIRKRTASHFDHGGLAGATKGSKRAVFDLEGNLEKVKVNGSDEEMDE